MHKNSAWGTRSTSCHPRVLNTSSSTHTMMDPPVRGLRELSELMPSVTAPSNPSMNSVSTLAAAVPSSMPAEKSQGEPNLIQTSHRSTVGTDTRSDQMLGQLSFAPATQTTVVTTTTTTTTSFPPLVMKAPHYLNDLDSKLYPLASSPTPKSIKRFCFDIGGRPTFFREADDAPATLNDVCQSNNKFPSYTSRSVGLILHYGFSAKKTAHSSSRRWWYFMLCRDI